MSCESCLKVNMIPECLGPYAGMEISNLSVPSQEGEDLILIITDMALNSSRYYEFTEGEPIDISDAYPLMQHYYKLEVVTTQMIPVLFVLTNPDDTEVEGCCIELIPAEGLEWSGGEYELSTTNCVVA